MQPKNLRLKLIMLFHPKYKLVADNFCGIDSLKGCTVDTTVFNHVEYESCHSDNGNSIYPATLYEKLVSSKKEKLVKYKTEYFYLADELYQKVLVGDYIPIKVKGRKLSYERKNN